MESKKKGSGEPKDDEAEAVDPEMQILMILPCWTPKQNPWNMKVLN